MSASAIANESQDTSPVYIGFDAEEGHVTSTSDEAIRIGILTALDEINRAGGVLGGRNLELLVKDNRSVPARGIKNIKEFSEIEDLVAVFGGKFSPVMIEELDILHEKKMILMDVWGAADIITDHDYAPNYCFRVSLKDSWAIKTMIDYARKKGLNKLGVLLPVTGWGRSNQKAIQKYLAAHPETSVTSTLWYNWGDKSLLDKYITARASGAESILLVANEAEGSILVKEIASLPKEQRLPVVSHWGVSGGQFTKMTGEAIDKIDFSVVQTYSFFDEDRPEKLKKFYTTAGRLFNIKGPEDIPAPVGIAHAYDATHILALAINKAGSTNRPEIRKALEDIEAYDGLIKYYHPPFTKENHTALLPENLFMGRFRLKDGTILRIR
ncbi:MAG: ABC transporter substrate-binding protein [Candidatus Electrothrix sp. GW3-4]|uniref:ABC transporter substrate-binding protein n=1 Tax=Candidatus Electrothrix sp. GW3-4 TaxID=3126740 RepID=UPI0030D28ED0